MFYQITQDGAAKSASEVLISLISSGFGQSVILIIVLALIVLLVLKIAKSSNQVTFKILDKFLKDDEKNSDTFDVHSCEEKIKVLERKSIQRESRLVELEKLPDEVHKLSEVITEVKRIVDDE